WSAQLATGAPLQLLLVYSGMAVALATVLLEPLRLGSRHAVLRFWLDIGVVLIGVGALSIYVVPASQSGTTLAMVQAFVLGPALFSACAFAVLKLVLATERPFTRVAGRLLGLAALGEATLALLTMRTDLADSLSLIFALTLISNSLLALSARAQRTAPRGPTAPVEAAYRLTPLPYVSIASTNVLLIYALATGGLSDRSWAVLAATVASTALVLARQLMSLSESAWLLTELDQRLEELGGALNERDELTARLANLAYHDGLTGLANRALFDRSLELAVEAHRAAGASRPTELVAVLLVDLDGFKEVNDTYGHAHGDELLVQVAGRLRACVRREDVVARFGGDEFCLLINGSTEDATAAAGRIVTELGRPFDLGGVTALVGASVGLATLDPCTRNGHELVRRADSAMYTAKREGKGRVAVDEGGVRPYPGLS
ncbi:MAG: GGDEF domain-containing protein, partial [Actinobacteria bacterium]|nr:GGDEF domain-containing protein [Actinomycetota bacterium]